MNKTNAVTVKFDSLIICLHKDDHVAPQVHHDGPLFLWSLYFLDGQMASLL